MTGIIAESLRTQVEIAQIVEVGKFCRNIILFHAAKIVKRILNGKLSFELWTYGTKRNDMELKEFIKTAIADITEAVSELQEEMKNGTMVNPGLDKKRECTVHFDLTVESSKEGGADIKVISGGMSERSSNKISFDIAIGMPASGASKPLARPVYGNDGTSPGTQTRITTQKQ